MLDVIIERFDFALRWKLGVLRREIRRMPQARVVAGDREAQAILATVEANGFVLGASPDDRDTVSAIRATEQAYSFSAPHRPESLSPALQMIRESVYGRKGSLDAGMLQALGRFFQTYSDEEINAEAVKATLSEFGPLSFLGAVSEKQAVGKSLSKPWTGAPLLAEEHNRRVRAGRKGPHFAGKLDLSRITRKAVGDDK